MLNGLFYLWECEWNKKVIGIIIFILLISSLISCSTNNSKLKENSISPVDLSKEKASYFVQLRVNRF